jgi:hypothetical protein
LLDAVFPPFLAYLIGAFAYPKSYEEQKTHVQIMLFWTRTIVTCVVPYISTPWDEVLSPKNIKLVISIALWCSLLAPAANLADLGGLFERHVLSRMCSKTQAQMNGWWEGTQVDIAENYSFLGLIVFTSFIYVLLVPWISAVVFGE